MGSDQSHQSGNTSHRGSQSNRPPPEAQHSIRSSSPRPSISSDSDIPYVSYTVNRPIGDSPKLPMKSPAHSLRTKTPSPHPSPRAPRPKSYAGSTTAHEIVVVQQGVQTQASLETDPELIKLQTIPTFLPIMRGALNIPTVRDPEVLDKLDPQGLFQLCLRYQDHLRYCAEAISTEQNALAARIREVDFAIATLVGLVTERQKKFAKYAEQLGKVNEVSSTLKRCQMALTQTLESMETLNSMLPPEDRLEPFVMVTG